MSGVMILFAFTMSIVINLVEKKIVSNSELFNETNEVKETEAMKEVE